MTKPFCPQGYVSSQEGIVRAASQWFAEQIAAIKVAVADELAADVDQHKKIQRLTPVETLARAFSRPRSISESLLCKIQDVLTQTEHRLRDFLHHGDIGAYYFGGLFNQGWNTVERGFWVTREAEGILLAGTIWPFGEPSSFWETRPNYPLLLLETELDALLSADRKSPLPGAELRTDSRPKIELEPAIGGSTEGQKIEQAPSSAGNHGKVPDPPKRRKSQPAFERARRAIEALYPNGVPDDATESNKRLCKRVSEELKEAVSPDTILRAAGRRK